MPSVKDRPATLADLHEPKPVPIDIDAHRADQKRRQAEMDAKRDELMRCLNPAYAAAREYEKPVYEWTVSAQWMGRDHDADEITQFDSQQVVVAQDERQAWAMFCDKIGMWPSRRDAKPKFKRGKQLDSVQVAAMKAHSDVNNGDGIIPSKTIGPKPKKKRS